MVHVPIKLILFAAFWDIAFAFITGGSNNLWTASVTDFYSAPPQSGDPAYASVFGTNWLNYFMDFLSWVGHKFTDVFLGFAALLGFGSLTMYGQTVSLSAIAPLNIGMLAMATLGIVGLVRG